MGRVGIRTMMTFEDTLEETLEGDRGLTMRKRYYYY